MAVLVKEISLPNGLIVSFHDHTRRYFGDYYLVQLEIVCDVPISSESVTTEDQLREARALLGEKVVYRRRVEQMGVPSTEIERVRNRLVEDFACHSLPYFADPGFPRKLVTAELNKIKNKMNRLPIL